MGSDFRTVHTVNSAHSRSQFSLCGQRLLGVSQAHIPCPSQSTFGLLFSSRCSPVGSRGRSLGACPRRGSCPPEAVRRAQCSLCPGSGLCHGRASARVAPRRGRELPSSTAFLGLNSQRGSFYRLCVSRIHVPSIKSPPCGRRAAGFQAGGSCLGRQRRSWRVREPRGSA